MNAKIADGNQGCSLSTFERNAYFYGKLLTTRDFQAEQQYFIDKGRTVHRLLHGTGIVCGLDVLAARIQDTKLVIDLGEGYALDCCGREIVIPTPQLQITLDGWQPGKNYVYVEYHEKKKEPTPPPGATVAGDDDSCNYGRISELYGFSVTQTAPAAKEVGSLMEHRGEAFTSPPYPQPKCPECTDVEVFLAVVDIAKGGAATINTDETAQYRSVVYSNPLLRDLLLGHLADFDNPHRTTAEQVKALVSVNGVTNPGGDIKLESADAIQISVDSGEHTITVGEKHSVRSDNPHYTTAKQVGALVSVAGVDNPGDNIHFVAQGAIQITPDNAAKTITVSENHSTDLYNPHKTMVSINHVPNDTNGNLSFTSLNGSVEITQNGPHGIDLKIAQPQQQWPVIQGTSWEPGKPMPRKSFFDGGVKITFSEPMHQKTLTPDTIIVTIELPENEGIAGSCRFRSLIVDGEIHKDLTEPGDADDSETWFFKPRCKITPQVLGKNEVRCRVVLKGNAVLAADGIRHLDGDVFVIVDNGDLKHRTPSGDGHEGGDFESWFYLEAKPSAEEPGQEDDFTVIDGIGPTFDKRLREANVHTFGDLAALTSIALAAILRCPVKRVEEDRLIEQARQLAEEG